MSFWYFHTLTFSLCHIIRMLVRMCFSFFLLFSEIRSTILYCSVYGWTLNGWMDVCFLYHSIFHSIRFHSPSFQIFFSFSFIFFFSFFFFLRCQSRCHRVFISSFSFKRPVSMVMVWFTRHFTINKLTLSSMDAMFSVI